jgi:hypothetical protein
MQSWCCKSNFLVKMNSGGLSEKLQKSIYVYLLREHHNTPKASINIMCRIEVLVILLSLVTALTFAVQPNCDPFQSNQRTIQSTCSGSTIEYGANGTVLTLTASLTDCATTNTSISSVSVFFDQIITPNIVKDTNEWILSYSIMWSDPSTNCVVDITSTSFSTVTPKQSYLLPNDTNGLNNDPLTVSSLILFENKSIIMISVTFQNSETSFNSIFAKHQQILIIFVFLGHQ